MRLSSSEAAPDLHAISTRRRGGRAHPRSVTLTTDSAKALCIRSMQIMVDGTLEDFEAVVHPEATNREAKDEPPETRGRGPAAFYATARWLRGWFDDLAFEVHDIIAEGDLVVVHNTMSGRHTGVATIYGPDGRVEQAMPPTGQRFAATQTHWFRIRDGLVVEHWANRDDQGMAMQLGWVPPTLPYLVKMGMATRRARRAEASRSR
jgi:predicted ester cyclase